MGEAFLLYKSIVISAPSYPSQIPSDKIFDRIYELLSFTDLQQYDSMVPLSPICIDMSTYFLATADYNDAYD
jgi:hypothetical protein